MKVLLASKALVVGAYQHKLREIAAFEDIDLVAVVPPSWGNGAQALQLETSTATTFKLVVSPIAFNGSFHLFFFPRLGRILDTSRPAVVHFDEEAYNLATFLAVWQCARRRIPVVFFTWQNLVRRYPPPFSWIERYVFRHAAGAIAGTNNAADVLRQKGFQRHIWVVPQFGVDTTVYAPLAIATPRPAFTIGFGGRLVTEKGVHLLLQAAARLKSDWRLRIIGGGPEEHRLQAQARELGIGDRVAFDGSLPSAAMPAALCGLDVLVLPSLSQPNWIEQFGRILVEAMACAVPVVGSTCGEIPSVIGDAGVIVPEGDVAALASALEALAQDARYRRELGLRGRQRVEEHFTQQQVAARTVDVYQAVRAQARPLE